MRAVAPRAAIARFATHRSAILRAQFLMRPVDMDKVVAFGGSQRVLGKCCIWLTRMQAMRMRLNQRWFDSRAVQATLALCVALLPEPSAEQLRYCSSCCSILALCAVLLALVLLALLLALRLKLRWFDSRAVQATLALCVALLPELTPEQLCSSAAIAASCCEFSKSSMHAYVLGSHGPAVPVDPWAAALRLSAAVPFFLLACQCCGASELLFVFWLANVAVSLRPALRNTLRKLFQEK